MKQSLILVVCVLVAFALARPDVNRDAVKASIEKVKKAHAKCQEDPATAVPEPPNGKPGPPPPSPNQGAHVLCISKALGWQNEDGSVNKANIESKATAIFGNNANLQAIIDECSIAKDSPEATAQHLFSCYRKHSPRPEEGQKQH